MNREDLLGSISETVADYRRDEIEPRTPARVDRWVRQFPVTVQSSLLLELDHVLQQTYISRRVMVEHIASVLTMPELVGPDPRGFWQRSALLNIQQRGRSQAAMLELFAEGLRSRYGLDIASCDGTSGQFIYLDDALFSGLRIGNDLSAWIATVAPPAAVVHIAVRASHSLGQYECLRRLHAAAADAGKTIGFRVWPAKSFENRKAYRDTSTVLWPAGLPDDAAVHAYAESEHRFPFAPRPPGGPLGPFSSEGGRQLLERELLIAGVRIRNGHVTLRDFERPLGFSNYGLGFGSTIVTYRNCPNNAPLALWWDAGALDRRDHWYPLFPRKTYAGQGEPDDSAF